ncbi:hypothetical protein AHF37_12763, partial [Paragonimus kellicotti]
MVSVVQPDAGRSHSFHLSMAWSGPQRNTPVEPIDPQLRCVCVAYL